MLTPSTLMPIHAQRSFYAGSGFRSNQPPILSSTPTPSTPTTVQIPSTSSTTGILTTMITTPNAVTNTPATSSGSTPESTLIIQNRNDGTETNVVDPIAVELPTKVNNAQVERALLEILMLTGGRRSPFWYPTPPPFYDPKRDDRWSYFYWSELFCREQYLNHYEQNNSIRYIL